MRQIRSLLFVLWFTVSVGFGAERIKGVVTDNGEVAIPGATVIVHWDSAGSTVGLTTNVGVSNDVVTKSDAAGRFSVELPPGFYDVFISASAFSPVCLKIRVTSAPIKPLALRLRLDPLVIKELGDEVTASLPGRKE